MPGNKARRSSPIGVLINFCLVQKLYHKVQKVLQIADTVWYTKSGASLNTHNYAVELTSISLYAPLDLPYCSPEIIVIGHHVHCMYMYLLGGSFSQQKQ